MGMMVYTGMLLRYKTIGAPFRREWRQILFASKPQMSLPMAEIAAHSIVRTILDVNMSGLPAIRIMFTYVSLLVPG
jgi:hypothetical protein